MATLIKRNFISSPSLSNLPLDCISIIILRTNFKSTRSLTIFQFQREISVKLFCKRGLRNRFEYPIHYRIKWLESTVAGDSVISWVSLEMVPARACSSSPSNGELLGYWKGNNVSRRRIFLPNKFFFSSTLCRKYHHESRKRIFFLNWISKIDYGLRKSHFFGGSI